MECLYLNSYLDLDLCLCSESIQYVDLCFYLGFEGEFVSCKV